MRIDRLDHLVLTVRDLDAAIGFYTGALGMQAVTFGPQGQGDRVKSFSHQYRIIVIPAHAGIQ